MDTPSLTDPSGWIDARRGLLLKLGICLKKADIPPLYVTTDEIEQVQRTFLFRLIAMDYLYDALKHLANEKTILRTIGSMVESVLSFIEIFAEELSESDHDDLANDIDMILAQGRLSYEMDVKSYETDVKVYFHYTEYRGMFHAPLLVLTERVDEVKAMLDVHGCLELYAARITELDAKVHDVRSFVRRNYEAVLATNITHRHSTAVYNHIQQKCKEWVLDTELKFEHKSLCSHNGRMIREFFCTIESGVFIQPERMAEFDRWCNVVKDVKAKVPNAIKRALLFNRICYFVLILDCGSPIIDALIWATRLPFLFGLD